MMKKKQTTVQYKLMLNMCVNEKRQFLSPGVIFGLREPYLLTHIQGREKMFANLAKLQPGRARKKYLATMYFFSAL